MNRDCYFVILSPVNIKIIFFHDFSIKIFQILCSGTLHFCPSPNLFSSHKKITVIYVEIICKLQFLRAPYLGVSLEPYLRLQLLPDARATKKDLASTIVLNSCRNAFLSVTSMYNCQHIVETQWMPNRRTSRRQKAIICWACMCSTQCPKQIFSAALCLVFWHAQWTKLQIVNFYIQAFLSIRLVKITEIWIIYRSLKPYYIQLLNTAVELFNFHK